MFWEDVTLIPSRGKTFDSSNIVVCCKLQKFKARIKASAIIRIAVKDV
jgi:hypothetical protein